MGAKEHLSPVYLRHLRSPAPVSELLHLGLTDSQPPAVFTRQIGTGWDPPADNSSSFFPVSLGYLARKGLRLAQTGTTVREFGQHRGVLYPDQGRVVMKIQHYSLSLHHHG